MLFEYEQDLVGADAVKLPWEEVERLDREKTIEHILPQSPTDSYWTQRFDPVALEKYTHDLGNLVLTADNSSYSNKPFPGKRGAPGSPERCYANSNLMSERELANVPEWTASAILERRQRLVDWALKRWSVPGGPVPVAPIVVEDADDDESARDVTADPA